MDITILEARWLIADDDGEWVRRSVGVEVGGVQAGEMVGLCGAHSNYRDSAEKGLKGHKMRPPPPGRVVSARP